MADVPPLLDQVSSQALTRLAASRGQALSVVPAGEEAVPARGRSWARLLPYLFLALGLFAVGSMAYSLYTSLDGDPGWSDAIELALMALLVGGVAQQVRAMVRPTRVGRWLSRGEAVPAAAPPPPLLDAVSAEELAARRALSLPGTRRASAAKRAGSRLFDRTANVTLVALSVLAFAGMLFACGYIAWAAGPWEPGLWLTVPFAGLTGFGSFQVFRSARRAAFRGRPFTVLSRAFRDSVRVWGSGTMATKVALTTTATASVAGAAVAPAVFQRDTPYDLFLIDSETSAFYRVDLNTNTGVLLGQSAGALRPVGLGATASPLSGPEGRKLPKGSLLTVVETNLGQGLIAFRPGSPQPIPLGRLTVPLRDAYFAGGAGAIYAVTPDGAFWRIDPVSGEPTRLSTLSAPPGPIAYDREAGAIFMLSGSALTRIDPATGAERTVSQVRLPEGFAPCGMARGPGDVVFLADAESGAILAVRTSSGATTKLTFTGEVPPRPCAITLAPRR